MNVFDLSKKYFIYYLDILPNDFTLFIILLILYNNNKEDFIMKYFRLPHTDLEVSRIALGCMRIADKSVEEVEKLVKTALDQGINFLIMLIYMVVVNQKLFLVKY